MQPPTTRTNQSTQAVIHYVTVKGFQTTLRWFCDHWGKELAGHVRFHDYDGLAAKHSLPGGTYIFADIERLDYSGMENAKRIWRALTEHRSRNLVLNNPVRSMRRYELLRTLHETGINQFDVYKLEDARRPKRYPVFIRKEDDHRGPISSLLGSKQELDDAIELMIRSGAQRDDKIIEEFVDASDEENVFHLYGAFVVNDEIIPAFYDFSRNWVVKGEVQFSELLDDRKYVEQERIYVRSNPHEDLLRPIFQTAGIQYGRMDYAMVNGQIQVFEINTNPDIIEFMDVGGDEWLPATREFAGNFIEAMKRIDLRSTSGGRFRLPPPSSVHTRDHRSIRVRSLIHYCLKFTGLLRYEGGIDAFARRVRLYLFRY